MESEELERLVDGWIALQKAPFGYASHDALFWAYKQVWNLVASKPDDALQWILAVMKREASPVVMENLSAGPLEDLLAGHGDLLIDHVEGEAKRNPLFASAILPVVFGCYLGSDGKHSFFGWFLILMGVLLVVLSFGSPLL